MGGMRSGLRANVSRMLLFAAMTLLIVPLVANLLLLVAGTFYVSHRERPGAYLIGLESLSIVSVRPPPSPSAPLRPPSLFPCSHFFLTSSITV